MARSSSGTRSTRCFASVLLPSPDVPVMTKTGLTVEEPNELRALAVRQSADGLRLADAALVQEAGRLHAAELRHCHQDVDHLRRLDVLGRGAQDLLDPGGAGLQVLLQPGPPDADVVRPAKRLHPLV